MRELRQERNAVCEHLDLVIIEAVEARHAFYSKPHAARAIGAVPRSCEVKRRTSRDAASRARRYSQDSSSTAADESVRVEMRGATV